MRQPIRRSFLVLLAACSPPDAGEASVASVVGADLTAPVTLTLDTGPAYMGFAVDVTIGGAPPGATVGLAYAHEAPQDDATCPATASGCLDLVAPTLFGTLVADEGGVAVFRVNTPFDDPQPYWFQAVLLSPDGPGKTVAVEVDPLPYRTDTDGDRAFDANELMLGSDPYDRDSDDDGVVDGRDMKPLDPTVGAKERFKPRDVVVSDPATFLVDPEFEVDTGRIVWATRHGEELWLARLDLVTGAMVPASGKGTLLATNVAGLDVAENGPEWTESAVGSHVLYAVPDGLGGWSLAHAYETSPEVWTAETFPGPIPSFGPLGQHDRSAPVNRMSWWRTDPAVTYPRHGWGTVDQPDLGLLPGPLTRADDRYTIGLGAVMSLTAKNPLSTVAPGHQQIGLFDTDLQTTTWVTDDATYKYDAWVWIDPRSGDPVAVVSRGAFAPGRQTEAAVYRRVEGVWTFQKAVSPQPSHPYVIMPRPLVWNGRSYIHFTASQGADPHDRMVGQIWLASIDTDDPLLRRIDGTDGYVKLDSEGVTVGARPWVYYSEARPGKRLLRRCELGLP
jgi:hypothetical protein